MKASRSKATDSAPAKHSEFSIEQSIEVTIQEMLKEREENVSIALPMKFIDYYNSPELLDLIRAIHMYCRELFKLEAKLQSLEEEAKSKGLPMPTLLPSETRRLQEKAREMAMKYGWILINNKTGRNRQEDHSFYETVIRFIIRVLSPAFEKQEIARLDEELNRLFRSTAFNMSHRRMAEEEKLRKFPQFRAYTKKESEDSLIKRIEVRNRIPK